MADREKVWTSRALFERVKLDSRPAFRIGFECGLSASAVTALIRNYTPVERDDPRVLALAAAVGLPAERAFSKRPVR